jgi:serine/threonine protein phosphatase 1
LAESGGRTLQQYRIADRSLEADISWLKNLPLFYENDHVLVSHAGVTDTPNPFSEMNSYGVLWKQVPLKNMARCR